MRFARFVAALAALLWAGAAAAQTPYTDLGLLISSKRYRYGYAYAPAIVREGGVTHMLYCSYGRPGIWDFIRYARSTDGGRSWSDPVVAVEGSDEVGERAACDPSVVRYQAPDDDRPYWYLFYSGNAKDIGTAIFLARADEVTGPYAKWTRRGTWEVDAADPAAIMQPGRPKPDNTGFYGAGQQSVVVSGRSLWMWYTDDTGCAAACPKVLVTRGREPTRLPPGAATDVQGLWSVDVKQDPLGGFALVGIAQAHEAGSALVARHSADGFGWDGPRVLCGEGCLDRYAHNAGLSGDATGALTDGPALVVYGGPLDRDRRCGTCWGRWDLFGGLVPPTALR
ncbi:MAG: hypothetical protein JO048_07275 [Methylobacteriaceae bacterium]|nr:hypothetical protein [Methylobacteriaceae bacterium]